MGNAEKLGIVGHRCGSKGWMSAGGAVWFSVSHSILTKLCYTRGYTLPSDALAFAVELSKIVLVALLSLALFRKLPRMFPIQWGYLVCAFLYMITNILTFEILSNTPVHIYVVLAQHKIVLVAVLSSVLLNKHYTRQQWIACALLVLGIVISHGTSRTSNTVTVDDMSPTEFGVYEDDIVKAGATVKHQRVKRAVEEDDDDDAAAPKNGYLGRKIQQVPLEDTFSETVALVPMYTLFLIGLQV